MVTPHLPWKFHANWSSRFLVMLLTKKQTNKERWWWYLFTIPRPRSYRGRGNKSNLWFWVDGCLRDYVHVNRSVWLVVLCFIVSIRTADADNDEDGFVQCAAIVPLSIRLGFCYDWLIAAQDTPAIYCVAGECHGPLAPFSAPTICSWQFVMLAALYAVRMTYRIIYPVFHMRVKGKQVGMYHAPFSLPPFAYPFFPLFFVLQSSW